MDTAKRRVYKFEDLLNTSNNYFVDISSEEYRAYSFVNGTVTIKNPLALSVSKGGGHRLFDDCGDCYYIPPGWLSVKWKVKPGSPHFVI